MIGRRWILALALSATALGVLGCGVELADTSMPDPADFDSSDTQEARTASWERLVGAWQSTSGSLYEHLVFQRTPDTGGHHFFGMRAVVCVRAPCPPVREDGYFTSGSSTLTLRTGAVTQRLRHTLSGENLTILSGDRVLARYRREASYCTMASDCLPQGATLYRCPGAFQCASNVCDYNCGSGATCLTLRCASGMQCEMTSGVAGCVAIPGHGYGAMCGGIAAVRCDSGYTCVLGSRTPDSAGYCHPLSDNGGPCGGGSTRFPAVCADGLNCVGPAAGSPVGSMGVCRGSGPSCATVRCASGTRCEMVASSPRCVPARGLGATCGGIAGLRCDTGFTCVLSARHPDASGVCHATANEGGACGGATRYPAVCADGLTCDGPAVGAPLGASGVCRAPSGPSCAAVRCISGTHCEMLNGRANCVANTPGGGYGAMCAGIAGLRCAAGYSCVLSASFPDASGICHAESSEGGSCGGGSIRYPAVCTLGLRCVGPSAGSPPGATGVCRR